MQAFLIDAAKRNQLLTEDPSLSPSSSLIFEGRTSIAGHAQTSGLFMIMMKSSENYHWPWSDAPDEATAEHQFSATYPALHRHFKQLEQFKDPKSGKLCGLRHREDQGRWWWELRSCAYYDAFEKPKIIYQVIQFHSRYCLDRDGRLSNDKTFFLPADDPWLLAVLNSPLMWRYNWRHLTHLKDEALSPMAYKIQSILFAANNRKSAVRLQTMSKSSLRIHVSYWWDHLNFGLAPP